MKMAYVTPLLDVEMIEAVDILTVSGNSGQLSTSDIDIVFGFDAF